MARLSGLSHNLAAFLDTLAFSEGTSTSPTTRDEGYDQIVGRTRFDSYATHPNRLVRLPKLGISSTAAGRYQLLARYWVAYKARLGLKDFSPVSQDLIAIQQIRERKALPDIAAGDFDAAVAKCSNIWASLPGAGYGQHEHKLDVLREQYAKHGGQF